jgi:hypothetical protein
MFPNEQAFFIVMHVNNACKRQHVCPFVVLISLAHKPRPKRLLEAEPAVLHPTIPILVVVGHWLRASTLGPLLQMSNKNMSIPFHLYRTLDYRPFLAHGMLASDGTFPFRLSITAIFFSLCWYNVSSLGK